MLSQVGAARYMVGQRPVFRLVITNIGAAACTRDLDPWLQELIVSGPGGSRLWSSNDCSPTKRPTVKTLEPGKPAVFTVDWAGRTSAPGCPAKRDAVGPGNYQLTGKLGALSSGPAPFSIIGASPATPKAAGALPASPAKPATPAR